MKRQIAPHHAHHGPGYHWRPHSPILGLLQEIARLRHHGRGHGGGHDGLGGHLL